MSTLTCQANISQRTLRSAAEKVLIHSCFLGSTMGDVYSAMAAHLGVNSASISGDPDACKLIRSVSQQRHARLDAAVPFYPGEELSFNPQCVALPFHPFAPSMKRLPILKLHSFLAALSSHIVSSMPPLTPLTI
mmetsp:Transcript_79073/g.157188  ORF Transcript_79073/g.157188 Transcript_79073/m.157188 type:complete len:134 (-) Transcript_79073:773-1174(-)